MQENMNSEKLVGIVGAMTAILRDGRMKGRDMWKYMGTAIQGINQPGTDANVRLRVVQCVTNTVHRLDDCFTDCRKVTPSLVYQRCAIEEAKPDSPHAILAEMINAEINTGGDVAMMLNRNQTELISYSQYLAKEFSQMLSETFACRDANLEKISWLPVGLASIYGGYFGAGLSVIVLSALGLTIEDSLTRLNALKQAVAFAVNIAAAVFFLFSGQVLWTVALVMAIGALIGGSLGGRLAGKVKPFWLRWIVVTIGVAVSIIYFVK